MKDISTWQPCGRPGNVGLRGQHACLEPFNWADHGCGLFTAVCSPEDDDLWTYMPAGPFHDLAEFQTMLEMAQAHLGWQTMVILNAQTMEIMGMASYMRIREDHGSAEVGCVAFGKKLQQTTIATDAMFLMADHVLSALGYRRYEWKCNAENDASMRAAKRFGFTYEGTFRQDMIVKGLNRDTAWFSIMDSEWPKLAKAFCEWLEPENFDHQGKQRQKLEAFQK